MVFDNIAQILESAARPKPQGSTDPEKGDAPFLFDERDRETLESAVYTALGAASMGWGKPARGRIFKSEWVQSIGVALMTEIARSRVANNKSVAERVAELDQRWQERVKNQVDIINRILADSKAKDDEIARLNKKVASMEGKL